MPLAVSVTCITSFYINPVYISLVCDRLASKLLLRPTFNLWIGIKMMDRHGFDTLHTRDLFLADVMRGRTELLILMANDFLRGKPLGSVQRQAIQENALLVEHDCVASISAIGKEPIDDLICDHIRFFYYLKSLAEMMKSVVQGVETDAACKRVIHDHIHVLAEMLDEDDQRNDPFIENCLSLLLIKLAAVI